MDFFHVVVDTSVLRPMHFRHLDFERRLGEEMTRVDQALVASTNYYELISALKTVAVLTPKFHGAVLSLLPLFVESIQQCALTTKGKPIDQSCSSAMP